MALILSVLTVAKHSTFEFYFVNPAGMHIFHKSFFLVKALKNSVLVPLVGLGQSTLVGDDLSFVVSSKNYLIVSQKEAY